MPMVLSKDARQIILQPGKMVMEAGVPVVKQAITVAFQNEGHGFVTGLSQFRRKNGDRGVAKGTMDTAAALKDANDLLEANGEEPWTEEELVKRLKNPKQGYNAAYFILDEEHEQEQPNYIVVREGSDGTRYYYCNLCDMTMKKAAHFHIAGSLHQANLAEATADVVTA